MNRRQKIIVSVTGIFLVLLLLVGLTYAYFLTKINGNENTKSISVTTANLALVYGDGNGIISAEKIQPGTTLNKKEFTVKNEGNDTTDYVVVIEDVKVTNVSNGSTTTFESNDFIYTLTCKEGCNGVDNETTFPMTGGILVGNSIEVGKTHTYELIVAYKETGLDQSNDMNKSLEAKVNIADPNGFNPYVGDKGSLAYAIINNAIALSNEEKSEGYAELRITPLTTPAVETTMRYNTSGEEATSESSVSISTTYQKYYWTYGTGYEIDPTTGKFTLTGVSTCQYNDESCHETLVGKYIVSTYVPNAASNTNTKKPTTNLYSIYKVTSAPASSTSTITMKVKLINKTYYSVESTLSITPDDYGTSYYYRGGVKNNYLEFNNMCWRIVRIEGDGAVKIILADANAGCSEATLEKTDSAFIGTGNYGYTDDNKADYENSAARTSSMKYRFDVFLNGGSFTNDDGTTKTYTAWNIENLSKLKTTQACIGDTTNAYTEEGVLMTEAEKQTAITNYNGFYYNSYVRLYGKGQTANATLICGANGGKTSETQIYPLTADEVVFAGAKTEALNYLYYLDDNAINNAWWTLTPANYYANDNIYLASEYISPDFLGGNMVGLRPAVSLLPGTQLDSGDGSISNPYTIK